MSISRRLLLRNAAIASALLRKKQCHSKSHWKICIKDYYKDDFRIGTAISTSTLLKNDEHMLGLIAREFDAITAENCMKWEPLRPKDKEWIGPWLIIRRICQKIYVYVGHNLVWHSQVPKEVFKMNRWSD